MKPIELVAFGVIIDDIIFPDGQSRMGVLGGGGVQAAFGMRLWNESVGISAGVGVDFEDILHTWLIGCGIDLQGLRINHHPTPRAWQVMEFDGRRTQVFRSAPQVNHAQLGRSLDYLPGAYRQARGFHLGIHPDEPDLDFLASLRQLGGLVSVETFKPADRKPALQALNNLLALTDIFSLNLLEAISLVGDGSPEQLINRLAGAGGRLVVLRMGERGSLALDARSGKLAAVPAALARVVDPIGAGNAFCGGFLAGWLATRDLLTASRYGAVAASLLIEQVGVPELTPATLTISRQRLRAMEQSTNG